MDYNHRDIERRWFQYWNENHLYQVTEDTTRPKYYVLNMFPYPSGAGLHVGHPLGYIASDIYARYQRLNGYNVLNPMGYDAYGLPAEQYAIQTGQHPEKTTTENIARYRQQLDRLGLSFDWQREVRTCDPAYYHWTQWAFCQMYNHYYDHKSQKARPIQELIDRGITDPDELMNYRIAYLADKMVNWCPKLGTVLANDEVVDGLSVRGGYPVEQRRMRQWCLRVSAYAQRLLDGLDNIEWSESIKDTQRNWIGRSEGTELNIPVWSEQTQPTGVQPTGVQPTGARGSSPALQSEQTQASNTTSITGRRSPTAEQSFKIFTTRADTLYGVTFFVLAPESDLATALTTPEQKEEVDRYIAYVKGRTERERMIDHTVTGVFSGSYGINPITGDRCPIYIAEYVLAGYGTGAIMAVPAHDSRDYAFAKHFGLPIIPLIEGADVTEQSYDAKEGIVINSPGDVAPSPHAGHLPPSASAPSTPLILNGLTVKQAIARTKEYVAANGLGRVVVNYRLRDAIFSRQRYWGEPFPVYYKDGQPHLIPEHCLPLQLPEVDNYLPTADGQPPLGNAVKWCWDEQHECVATDGYPLELNTMPGFAGSSAYYLRYMDPKNDSQLVAKQKAGYWQAVDLYVGGSEHATGHLIYSRFWNKFLHDIGVSPVEEPFQRLINQGMIQGRSSFVYRQKGTNTFVSADKKDQYDTQEIHVDVNIVAADVLDIEAFRQWRPEYRDADFILSDDGKYRCGYAVEKMSKSMYNVVNPDLIVDRYGADTLRLYEMFLGPVEQSKPWDTNGIDGCHRFLKKLWTLVTKQNDKTTKRPNDLKALHVLIGKVDTGIRTFSYNTAIAAFMTAVSQLQGCTDRDVLRALTVLISPFCPFIAEELWHQLGEQTTVLDAKWPQYDESLTHEDTLTMPVQFSGKTRYTVTVPAEADKEQALKIALHDPRAQKYTEGKQIIKTIVVPRKIINIVCR